MIEVTKTEVLIDNANLRIIYRRGRTDFIWVTFNFWGHPSDHYWGQAIAERFDFSVLNFSDKHNLWHPNFSKHIHEILPILAMYPIRLGMGVSMGGYAAIKYSRLLKIDTTLAIVPQFSIDSTVIDDFRYNDWFNSQIHTGMTINSEDIGGNIFTLSDPHFSLDHSHQKLLDCVAPIIHIPTHFTGHFAIVAFQGTERMGSVISALLQHDTLALRKIANSGRRSSNERPCGLICSAWEKHEGWAKQALVRYKSQVSAPLLQEMLVEQARLHFHKSNFSRAISTMQAAISVREGQYTLYAELSTIMRARDRAL